MLTSLLLPPVTQTLLCVMWALPAHALTRKHSQLVWDGGYGTGEVLSIRGSILWNPAEGHTSSLLPQSSCFQEIGKEEQTAAEKTMTRRNFKVNGQLQLLSYTNTQPEVTSGSGVGQVSSVPSQHFPQRTGALSLITEICSTAPTLQVTERVGTPSHWVVLSCSSTDS